MYVNLNSRQVISLARYLPTKAIDLLNAFSSCSQIGLTLLHAVCMAVHSRPQLNVRNREDLTLDFNLQTPHLHALYTTENRKTEVCGRTYWRGKQRCKNRSHHSNEALSVPCHHVRWRGVWIKSVRAHLGCEFSSYMRSLPSLNKLIVCFVFFIKFSMKTRKYSLSPSVSILPS